MIDATYGWLGFEYRKLPADVLASQMNYWMVMPYLSRHKVSLGIQHAISNEPRLIIKATLARPNPPSGKNPAMIGDKAAPPRPIPITNHGLEAQTGK